METVAYPKAILVKPSELQRENRFRVCSCLNAVSLAISFLVSMIYGVYIIVTFRSILDDSRER